MNRYTLRHKLFAGGWSAPLTRELFERGHAAAMLPYDPQRDEVAKTVRRVVDKLLHAPTVRVKQLAATPNGDHYAEALRELFELKPGATGPVSAPETGLDDRRRSQH